MILPTDKFVPLNPDPPKAYNIEPLFSEVCTRCMKCVESCPKDAIKIE